MDQVNRINHADRNKFWMFWMLLFWPIKSHRNLPKSTARTLLRNILPGTRCFFFLSHCFTRLGLKQKGFCQVPACSVMLWEQCNPRASTLWARLQRFKLMACTLWLINLGSFAAKCHICSLSIHSRGWTVGCQLLNYNNGAQFVK